MTKRLIGNITIVSALFVLSSFALPKSWFKAGSDPNKYEMGVEVGAGHDGKNAATIKSMSADIKGFGTLMQNCLPSKFAGKRIRMSAFIKSFELTGWCGLWLRVDGFDSKKPISFDNMNDRAIRGTTDWKKYEIVLDVPANASNIAYGVLLTKAGQVWFDTITFEVVDNSVSPTGKSGKQFEKNCASSEPQNLNFEE
ncbi:MAG: hypothetical protein PSX36_00220 [bacterium]|nr:hypothetical protein [bacterium]